MKRFFVVLLCVVTMAAGATAQIPQVLVSSNATWRYFKGFTEASDPTNAWREVQFDDAAWLEGATPLHFGTNAVGGDDWVTGGTILDDMQGNYGCVYMRHPFVVRTNGLVDLKFGVYVDDGLVGWINGQLGRAIGASATACAFTNNAGSDRDTAQSLYEYSILANVAGGLRDGTNILCVQAFNHRWTNDDFRVAVQLTAFLADVAPPVVTAVHPEPGAHLTNLTQVTVTFSEPVTGVVAAHLLANGYACATVTGSGDTYTYMLPQPAPGTVQFQWLAGHTLTDTNGNRLDQTADANRWHYTLADLTPPTLIGRSPAPSATVPGLTEIQVEFSEVVLGVDAADLWIGGQPATNLVALGAKTFLFSFPDPGSGTVIVSWNPDHQITDTAAPPNVFDHTAWSWTYTVVPARDPVQALVAFGSSWRYYKGMSEASSPTNAWREPGFDDSGWRAGEAPFHFGTNTLGGDDELTGGTILSDMLSNYTTLYLRQEFVVTDTNGMIDLRLATRHDDGWVVWINGVYVKQMRTLYPGRIAYNSTAFLPAAENETGDFSLSLADLRPGTNLIAVQAFNRPWAATDNDFRIDVALLALYPDLVSPVVSAVDPPPNTTVTNLSRVTVTFDEPVIGVVAEDFLVNGDSATAVSGSGSRWTFSFNQPAAGRVQIMWDINHSVSDTNGNHFDETVPSASWEYDMVDSTPPTLVTVLPTPNAAVGSLTQIEVTFSEPVLGVDAADLRVNGQPALSVVPTGTAAYRFEFAGAGAGPATVSWDPSHGITDQASVRSAFVAVTWSYTVDPAVLAADVVINEVAAHWFRNEKLQDAEGDANDWIELHNRGAAPVRLLGWSLTTDPTQPGLWLFPNTNLNPGQYLVVFASGKDYATNGAPLHTNFRLNQFGEYLGLYRAGLPQVAASEYAPEYPEQRENISYGYLPSGTLAYFPTNAVTPGAANPASPSFAGVVSMPQASVNSGFFNQPFSVVLAIETPGATIRYTLDGSSPESGGILYSGPVPITGNAARAVTVLRAAALKTGWLPSRTLTHTYVFPEYVVYQPPNPAGFPSYWVSAERNDIPADYEMDPQVLNSPALLAEARQALTNIATLSIVSDVNLIFGTNQGVYVRKLKRGNQQPVNVQMLLPDGEAFSAPAGMEIQGGTSPDDAGSSWKSKKLSLRLLFKGDFGMRNLEYPLFPDSPVTEYNTVILDAGLNHWWHYNGGSSTEQQRITATCIHDQVASDLQKAMGAVSFHGRAVHVYLNGLYWGMHIMHERPDNNFGASYFGGDDDEYDVLKHTATTLVDGNLTAYNSMLSLARAGLANNANYEALQGVLDLPWLIDYMLLHFYVGNEDWAQHNWYALRRRVPDAKWRFISWDTEHAFEHINQNVTGVQNSGSPAEIHAKLLANPEYKLRFADHVNKHFFQEDGVFYVDPAHPVWDPARPERNRPAGFFMRRVNEIWSSLLCESARWGDSGSTSVDRSNNPLLRDRDYVQQLDCLLGRAIQLDPHDDVWNTSLNTGYFPSRGTVLLGQLRAAGLYPGTACDAPRFSAVSGRVPAGYSLFLTNQEPDGTVYYTTTGDDPRVYGTGAVWPAAIPHVAGSPVVLTDTVTVKARLLRGTTWSALTEATFTVGSLGVPLRITELMYHPTPAGSAGSRFEFLELQNIGATKLDLSYYTFDGISFQFPVGYTLNPGARIVLGSNIATNDWIARYPGVPVAGWFDGNLNNGGERIAIYFGAQLVTAVTYSDGGGWPEAADGLGWSLEVINPQGDPNDPANWRASASLNGSPGLGNPSLPAPAVVFNELMATNATAVPHDAGYPDWIELHHAGATPIDLSGWSLTDSGDPRKFVFPAGVILNPGEFRVVWCDATQPASTAAGPDLNTGFALACEGETLALYDAHTNRLDAISFGPQLADFSIGRVGSDWTLTLPTPGAANRAAPVAGTGSLVLNEWLANAPPGGSDWIELHNVSSTLPAGLRGIYLATSNALDRVLSLSFLAPRGFALLVADGNPGPDHLGFNLPKEGGAILLYDETGAPLDQVIYGVQMENVSEGRLPNGTGGVVSFPLSSSPAASNYLASYTGPHLNEVLARNQSATVSPWGQYADWIELENPAATAADLGGLRLADSPSASGAWVVPAGTTLEGHGQLVLWCDSSRPASTSAAGPLNTGFALNRSGGGVYLFNAQGQRIDAVEYGFQLADQSIGRLSGQWRLLTTPTPGQYNAPAAATGPLSDLRVNEWLAASTNGPDWFELHNRGALPVNLEGAYLTDDPSMPGLTRFRVGPLSFVGAHDWVVWIADADAGLGPDHVNFALDGLAETLRLYAPSLALIDAVDVGQQNPDVSQGRLPDSAATIAAFPVSASPGGANYLPLPSVVIHEVLAHADNVLEDAIELHNLADEPADVSGWYLSHSERDLQQYLIPAGPPIPAGGFRVFYEYQFNPQPGVPPSFALSSARGDQVHLSAATTGGNLTGYRTFVTFGPSANGVSQGRIPTSIGADFGPLAARTFGADTPASLEEFRTGAGASNAAPRVGPVVINEIMYHPVSFEGGAAEENPDAEFVELLNFTSEEVLLYDPAHPTNAWKLQDAVRFEFPPGSRLPAGAYCLVVNFDPALDPVALAGFRARYGVDPAVPVYGPWLGRLDNAGETVALCRPDTPQPDPGPDAGLVPYVVVDRVAYTDDPPWPTNGVDGGGASLQRLTASAYGNEPLHWRGQAPTAGVTNAPGAVVAPTLVTAPQSQTVIAGQPVTFSVTANGTAPLSYQWFFENAEIAGATASTYHLAAASPLHAGEYRVRVTNAAGAVTSPAATLTVLVPPEIVAVQPPSLTVPAGSNVVLSVSATGSEPLAYAWLFNAAPIEGAIASSLGIDNAQVADSGFYQAVVTNAAGAVTSAVVSLLVKIPPAISGQPQPLTVTEGQDAIFNVAATGDAILTFVWHVNGTPIPGAHSPTLTVPAVTAADHGNIYWVVVSNDVGAVQSAGATLTVLARPVLANLQRLTDGHVSFTVQGQSGRVYWVDTSTNFVTWQTLSDTPTPSGQSVVINTATNAPQMFYRARLEP
ncbi:MAG: lamin tail domain-containing protein [Verrucomicrobia bacterium]|nr:lamin tail domain-containing protein [Verrucomicrobiota bacterium]